MEVEGRGVAVLSEVLVRLGIRLPFIILLFLGQVLLESKMSLVNFLVHIVASPTVRVPGIGFAAAPLIQPHIRQLAEVVVLQRRFTHNPLRR